MKAPLWVQCNPINSIPLRRDKVTPLADEAPVLVWVEREECNVVEGVGQEKE